MNLASRKHSTFAPDLCVRGIGSMLAIAGMLFLAPVQAGGNSTL